MRPVIAYHATQAKFDTFDTARGDLGAHFGSLAQAAHISLNRHGGRPESHVMRVRLHLENPLRLKDVGSFHADGIAPQLERKRLLPEGLRARDIVREIEADWRKRRHYDPLLRQAIIDAGYDGVTYANTHEGRGDSFIAFFPGQIEILEQHVDIADYRHLARPLCQPSIAPSPGQPADPVPPPPGV